MTSSLSCRNSRSRWEDTCNNHDVILFKFFERTQERDGIEVECEEREAFREELSVVKGWQSLKH